MAPPRPDQLECHLPEGASVGNMTEVFFELEQRQLLRAKSVEGVDEELDLRTGEAPWRWVAGNRDPLAHDHASPCAHPSESSRYGPGRSRSLMVCPRSIVPHSPLFHVFL